MYPRTGEIMEPRFNIRVAELNDPNFVAPDAQGHYPQDTGNFVDEDSNHFEKNYDAYKQQQQGLGDQIQRYVDEAHIHATDANPAQDPTLMVMNPALVNSKDLSDVPMQMAASKFASQVKGFRTEQAHESLTLGIVANVNSGTIVNARVVAETPSTKIAGTVIAVGDAEFAVIWDDKTASVERKNDYELVLAQ